VVIATSTLKVKCRKLSCNSFVVKTGKEGGMVELRGVSTYVMMMVVIVVVVVMLLMLLMVVMVVYEHVTSRRCGWRCDI
jgi:hypothetical protein